MPKKTNKDGRKFKIGGFLVKTALAFVLVVIAVNVLRVIFDDRPETTVAVSGSVEDSIDAEGYIFKSMQIVDPQMSGFLESVAGEGEKVAMGETVAFIYQSEGDYAQKKALQDVEKQIAELENESVKKETYASDTARIEQSILQEIRDFNDKADRSPVALAALKENINKLITKKAAADGEIADAQANRLNELYAKRTELSSSGISQGTPITAPTAGLYSARVMPIENELSADKVDSLVTSDFDKLDELYENGGAEALDENVFKIVNDFKWYFVTVVNENVVQDIKVGKSVGLRFFDVTDSTIDGEIAYISGADNGRCVVAVSSEGYVDSIYSTPRASVEIVFNTYSGIKIPTESIRVVDGVRGVYVIRNGYTKFVEVDLLYNDKEQSIVKADEQLSMYDTVVTKYANIRDGMSVR